MSSETFLTPTVRVQAVLDSSSVGMREQGKPFATLKFKEPLPNNAYRSYWKSFNLYGNGLQYSLRDLRKLGLKGDVLSMMNQGSHNSSQVMSFGTLFELEIGSFNGKASVETVRTLEETQARSFAEDDDLRAALSGISTTLIEE